MNKTYLSVAIAISLLLGPITQIASAQVHVNGYTRRDGTYVAPHWRSAPDSTPMNNYSTQGNYNPYTGQAGTVNPYSQNTCKVRNTMALSIKCRVSEKTVG